MGTNLEGERDLGGVEARAGLGELALGWRRVGIGIGVMDDWLD